MPLALAFGVASGAGPMAGLYGAICVGLFASLFGGTPAQISGPTGPMTIVMASVFTQFAGQPAVAFTVVLMAGAFQILFGYLRLGRYVNLMPYPVISGFMTGIGCILIIMELDPLLGYPTPHNVINALTVLPDYLAHLNPRRAGRRPAGAGHRAVHAEADRPRRAVAADRHRAVFDRPRWPLGDVPLLGAIPGGCRCPQLPDDRLRRSSTTCWYQPRCWPRWVRSTAC